jgi:hypothetical protein
MAPDHDMLLQKSPAPTEWTVIFDQMLLKQFAAQLDVHWIVPELSTHTCLMNLLSHSVCRWVSGMILQSG